MQRKDIQAAIKTLQDQGVSLEVLKRAARRCQPPKIRRQRHSWAFDPKQKDGPCRSLSINEMLEAGYRVDES